MSRLIIGSYKMGEKTEKEKEEIICVRRAVTEFGIMRIDTAEMYGSGAAEVVVGKAIEGMERSRLRIIGKVLPQNANRIRQSCVSSLGRLNVDYFDMYLLHWREDADLTQVAQQMEALVAEGLIRDWGVSNFDVNDMEDLFSVEKGNRCRVNQVLYNLQSRGIEYDLIPWCRAHGVEVLTYSSVGHNEVVKQAMVTSPAVIKLSQKYRVAKEAILLAFALQNSEVFPIFKTSSVKHLDELMKANVIPLTSADMAALTAAFPSPAKKIPLEKI